MNYEITPVCPCVHCPYADECTGTCVELDEWLEERDAS